MAEEFRMASVPLAVMAMQLDHSDARMVDMYHGHLAKKQVTDMIRQLSPK